MVPAEICLMDITSFVEHLEEIKLLTAQTGGNEVRSDNCLVTA